MAGPITFYLRRLQQRLDTHGGRYFAGDRLSVADLKVLVWILHLKSGKLDHVPVDIADRAAPKLVEHCERIKRPPWSDRLLHEARTHRVKPDCRRAGIGVGPAPSSLAAALR